MIFSLLAAVLISTSSAMPAKINMAAKLDGNVASISASRLVVNGATVNVAANTVLVRRFGAKSLLSEFGVGDQVQVLGKWTDSTKTVINARLVRNLSIQKRKATFVGVVSTVSTTSFVLTPQSRPTQTVTVLNTTKYIVNHKIMVRGMWDNKLNTLTEVTLVKDYSLPTPAKPQ